MSEATNKKGIPLPIVGLIALVMFAVGAGMGVLGYVTVTGGSGEASEPASDRAGGLSLDDFGSDDAEDGEASDDTDSGAIDDETRVVVRRNVNRGNPIPVINQASDETETPEATEEPLEPMPITLSRGIFSIVTEESEARFNIDEDLRGQRITVVGVTDEVGGDIGVNFDNPADSIAGVIAINARTLVTDNEFRNRALRGQILRSAEDAFEFIEFVPTAIDGLPEDAITMSGDTLEFEIVGDLTIIETTQEVTFDVSVTLESEDRLSGLATATIDYNDFNLSIPSVPGVANVSDEVILEIDFVAELSEGEPRDEMPMDEEDDDSADMNGEAIDITRGIFSIVTEDSEARFNIDEDLNGQRITVTGVTDEVGGDIGVNFANPAESIVGTIAINARTLETDNNFRNRALRGQILRSAEDDFEFIEFVPTAIDGLPEDAITMSGDTLEFEITGDLTIIETTQEVTFEVLVTLDSAEELSGLATATIDYNDFNLSIPSVPGVANVSDEVILEIDFVAELTDSD
ncbi:MAG: YceI family protein [Aggregatilineales bacterium]